MRTKSEELFESFLTVNKLPFEKIKEDVSSRPDYLVFIGDLRVVFEVKELADDENFGVVKDTAYPHIKMHSRTPGDHVRRKIEDSKKQIQYGAKQGLPSILLIYNNLDYAFQRFGTEDLDFTTAMYGELTAFCIRTPRATSDLFSGNKQLLQQDKNTSFSAVGRLRDCGGEIGVTLFENVFSKVEVPYQQLPPCFHVNRIVISTEPPFPPAPD